MFNTVSYLPSFCVGLSKTVPEEGPEVMASSADRIVHVFHHYVSRIGWAISYSISRLIEATVDQ